MAATRALNTPELLEHILLFLPAKALLLLQRVATLWRDTVRRSDEFQQRLFRRPVTKSEKWTSLIGCNLKNYDAPFLVQALDPAEAACLHHVEDILEGACVVVRPNPLIDLAPYLYELSHDPIHGRRHNFYATITGYEALHKSFDRATILRPFRLDGTHPDLLRMFLTQPPPQRVVVDYKDGDRAECFQVVANPDGITVGDVLSILRTGMPGVDKVHKVRIGFVNCLFFREQLRWVLDAGIKKFRDLESKIGRPKALRIVGRDRKQSGGDIDLLLKHDNLDKVIAMGKLDAVADGESIADILAEYEENQRMQSIACLTVEGGEMEMQMEGEAF